MWTRRELKQKAKKSLMRNYGMTALTAIVLLFLLNASSYFDLFIGNQLNSVNAASTVNQVSDTSGLGLFSGLLSGSQKTLSDDYFGNDSTQALESEAESRASGESETLSESQSSKESEISKESQSASETENAQSQETLFPGMTYEQAETMSYHEVMKKYWAYIASTYSDINWRITIPLSLFWLLYEIFIGNIFRLGGCHFFMENADHKATMKELLYGFKDGKYGRNVLTMFIMNLKITLWSLLFYIPGLIKSLEYRMVPYLLADYPEIDRKEAFRLSKEMMRGEKWSVFVLDISFIFWMLADYICKGLVGFVYFNPYKYGTNAELYLKLKELKGIGSNETPPDHMADAWNTQQI